MFTRTVTASVSVKAEKAAKSLENMVLIIRDQIAKCGCFCKYARILKAETTEM